MKNSNKTQKIPSFKSAHEERKFWETHNTTEYFDLDNPIKMIFPNLRPTSKSITLRIPLSMYDDLKNLANKRDVPYQSMMKMFLAEKIEEQYGQS
jgi:predicted DNA binding CopG/RHH family protein